MSINLKKIEDMYDNAIASNYDCDRFKLLADSYQTVIKKINYIYFE